MKMRGDACHKGAWRRKRVEPIPAALPRRGGRALDLYFWTRAMANAGKIINRGKAGQRAARQARLAAALRENLKRRKQQARERAGSHQAPPAEVSSQVSSQDGKQDREPPAGAPDFRRNRNEE
jgi:hypothetical protein